MKRFPFLTILIFAVSGASAQTYVSFVDSSRLPEADTWGVITSQGTLSVTTMMMKGGYQHLFLRHLDTSFNQIDTIAQLTFDSDPSAIEGITDHKHIFLDDHFYISFSTVGDTNLYLFRTDDLGNRVGTIETVVSGASDPTDNMILTTDNEFIYVLQHKLASRHLVHKFTKSLASFGAPDTTSLSLPHNNVGSAIYEDGLYYMFTGTSLSAGASLQLTKWDQNWDPVGSVNTLIPTAGFDGNSFATGVVFEPISKRWYIAFHHYIVAADSPNIDIAVFDSSFNLLERQQITSPGLIRPHLARVGDNIFLTYDAQGNGVFIHKYKIDLTPVGVEERGLDPSVHVRVYPNPARESVKLVVTSAHRDQITVALFDIYGREVRSVPGTILPGMYHMEFDLSVLSAGMYMYRLTSSTGAQHSGKVLLLR